VQYIVIGILVLAAVAAVVYPLIRRNPIDRVLDDEIKLEARIQSYRDALRAGTVCDRCLHDNPAGSRFCADCGQSLLPTASQASDRPHPS
jgi:hypothetical protein